MNEKIFAELKAKYANKPLNPSLVSMAPPELTPCDKDDPKATLIAAVAISDIRYYRAMKKTDWGRPVDEADWRRDHEIAYENDYTGEPRFESLRSYNQYAEFRDNRPIPVTFFYARVSGRARRWEN